MEESGEIERSVEIGLRDGRWIGDGMKEGG